MSRDARPWSSSDGQSGRVREVRGKPHRGRNDLEDRPRVLG